MEQSPELRQVMLHYYEAVSKGDLSVVDHILSRQPGILWIGSDPQEWWEDRDKVLSVWKAQFEELGGASTLKPTTLSAWSQGDVGWVSDRPLCTLPDGTEVTFRITVVFRKEPEGWKIVQVHSSMGTPNEDVAGKALTV